MTLTLDRDYRFWRDVYDHPAVSPHVGLGQDVDLAAIIADGRVTPLRSDNGGFLFVQLDGIGRVFELHTMFRPEGWGREAASALREAIDRMFCGGAQLITTYEVAGHYRSQPPRSFRFTPCGDFAPVPSLNADLRTWILTKDAWLGSPVFRRMTTCH